MAVEKRSVVAIIAEKLGVTEKEVWDMAKVGTLEFNFSSNNDWYVQVGKDRT